MCVLKPARGAPLDPQQRLLGNWTTSTAVPHSPPSPRARRPPPAAFHWLQGRGGGRGLRGRDLALSRTGVTGWEVRGSVQTLVRNRRESTSFLQSPPVSVKRSTVFMYAGAGSQVQANWSQRAERLSAWPLNNIEFLRWVSKSSIKERDGGDFNDGSFLDLKKKKKTSLPQSCF